MPKKTVKARLPLMRPKRQKTGANVIQPFSIMLGTNIDTFAPQKRHLNACLGSKRGNYGAEN